MSEAPCHGRYMRRAIRDRTLFANFTTKRNYHLHKALHISHQSSTVLTQFFLSSSCCLTAFFTFLFSAAPSIFSLDCSFHLAYSWRVVGEERSYVSKIILLLLVYHRMYIRIYSVYTKPTGDEKKTTLGSIWFLVMFAKQN